MTNKEVGIQIKKARAESQLGQAELAKELGVTWEMISRYENGKSSARRNLEKIAEVLGKPIQYFFGVEEASISDEIKKLTELLARKSSSLQKGTDVPLIESQEGVTLNESLILTNQTQVCPSWIHARFEKVFAYKLTDVTSDVVDIGRGDVAFFSRKLKPKIGDFVLVRDDRQPVIGKYSDFSKEKIYAVLLAIEKRYYQ